VQASVMQKNLKDLKALKKKYNICVTIDKNMPDYSDSPFFKKKLETAEKFIAEHGLPESSNIKLTAKKRNKILNKYNVKNSRNIKP
jgi:hypothetical protein